MGLDPLGRGRDDVGLADEVSQLRLVDVEIAPDHGEDELAGCAFKEDGLGGLVRADAEEIGEALDRRRVRRLDLLHRQEVLRLGLVADEAGDLAVRGVIAVRADQDRVLAVRREGHELVGLRAAHHADVRADDDEAQPHPAEDLVVRLTVLLVGDVEPGLVEVEAVRVLHRELADPDQSAPGARLVAPLGLEVVDDLRELAVGVDLLPGEVGDDLLVRHREDHVAVGAVLEAGQLRTDRVIPATLAPDLGRVDDRHQHLLPADRVHLLADDLLDLLDDAVTQRQQAEEPGAERSDHRGAQHELVADDLDVARRFAQGAAEHV